MVRWVNRKCFRISSEVLIIYRWVIRNSILIYMNLRVVVSSVLIKCLIPLLQSSQSLNKYQSHDTISILGEHDTMTCSFYFFYWSGRILIISKFPFSLLYHVFTINWVSNSVPHNLFCVVWFMRVWYIWSAQTRLQYADLPMDRSWLSIWKWVALSDLCIYQKRKRSKDNDCL